MTKFLINKLLHYGLAYLFLFVPIAFAIERPSMALRIADIAVIVIYCMVVIYFYEYKHPVNLIPWIILMLCLVYFTLMMNIGCIMFFMFPAYTLPSVIKGRLNSIHGYIMIGTLGLILAAVIIIDLKNSLYALPYIIFLLIIIFANDRSFYQNRLKEERQLKDQQLARLSTDIERHRISQDLHDSLGQVFSILAIKSELALKMMEHSPEAAQKELREINDLSKTSLLKVREIVDDVKSESLATELKQSQILLQNAGIDMQYEVKNLPDNFEKHDVVMLLKELVNNAYKHSGATAVEIKMSNENGQNKMIYRDNGIGIQDRSIRLRSLESRVNKLNGHLSFSNLQPGLSIEIEWG
ncbi:sensor histidine kinase [Macrococcus brunensis]|uniref:sensor histidine kinase n=1 Tax=Macrococcus brunensis TaxID=198483 RepID=UPI001EF0750D|nr:histidine kinase [Macrococcus brunensis]ULG74585.1 histidine kinase [Macrococcus brunensis]